MSADIKDDDSNLDRILTEVGELGLFQVITFLMICLPNILLSSSCVNYVIMADSLDYRCKVPGCDVGENHREIEFDQPWLSSAIPSTNGRLYNCFHHAVINRTDSDSDKCTTNMFDSSVKIACTEFVYASDERNIQTEFNIHCEESYKLALPGIIYNLGGLIVLPLTGFLSDKFGRALIIISGVLMTSVFGTMKAFVPNFPMYIAFQFFEAIGGSCAYAAIFVLSIELVHSKYRILSSTIVNVSHPLGSILLGLIAMHFHDFRTIIKILYPPGLIVIVYFWLLPESIRWLLVTGRVSQAINTLKTIACVNGKELSTRTIEMINQKHSTEPENNPMKESGDKKMSLIQSFMMIFRSKTLCGRFFICCYQWIVCCFSYYGLSQSSTHISVSNRYLNFMLVVTIEIPSILITQPLLSRFKRRALLLLTFSVAGISIITTPFIPEDNTILVLICYLLGKASMTAAFTIIYIFTAEQWPTNLRSTIISFCSMTGRIGAMVAPIVVVYDIQYHSLSAFLFGGTAIVAAALTVLSPETYSKKLPDTIEEAEHL